MGYTVSVSAIGLTGLPRALAAWHWGGFAFLLTVGSLLHFVYDWSGRSPAVAAFSAVNESVWEHLKLGFWSLVLFSVLEFWFVRPLARNYLAAKAAGILAMQLFILGVFYSHTALLGRNVFVVNIASYVLGAGLCQLVGYRIVTARPWALPLRLGLVGLLGLHALALVVFTFVPPRAGIFRDSDSGTYGVHRQGEP